MDPTASIHRSLSRADLQQDLRCRAFAPSRGPDRIGVEVELIPVDEATGRVLPLSGDGPVSSVALLRNHGGLRGWRSARSDAGSPAFLIPGGGIVSFEPGGQLEYSSPALASVDAVLDDLACVVGPLIRAGAEAGVAFVTRGMDPINPVAEARLHLTSPRYSRMSDHYDRVGPWGRRMMRQSAAIHVNLDQGDAPLDRWAVANAAVPAWTAMFANSRRAEGKETGHRSVRALQWRCLDPSRSGTFGEVADPVQAYLDFALGADAFLVGPDGTPSEPLAVWLDRGRVDASAWSLHLSTLFPEVRPRGYLELRPFDALPPRWYAAPLVLTTGLLYDRSTLAQARELLPPPTPEALERAGRLGLGDPTLSARARDLAALALEGAARLGGIVGGRSLDVARAFVDEFTNRARDPGDESADRAF